MRVPGLVALWVAGALACSAGAGIRKKAAPSLFLNSPLIAVLEGRDPQRIVVDVPPRQPLAEYRNFRVFDARGQLVGRLDPILSTRQVAWIVKGRNGNANHGVELDRKTRSFFRVRNAGRFTIGRWVKLDVPFGSYEWRNDDDEAIASLAPRPGTRLWELRGGDAAVNLAERFGWPVRDAAARQVRFRQLFRGR